MRRRWLPVLALALGLGLWLWPRGEVYVGGIQVNEPDHQAWVQALDAAGMNTVSVTVYAHQGDWDSADLWWDEEEPWVLHEIRTARAAGLRVALVLRVALDHAFPRNRFLWHGMIMPADEAALAEWFRRYRRFVLQWAAVAEREGVELLAVASEMNALTSTLRVTELPVLEEYWSNEEKVEREQDRIRRHAEVVEERHLLVRGNDNYRDLESYLEDEEAAHRAWARQTAHLDSPDPLRRIHRRRGLLERHWRELIAAVRRVYPGELTYAANFDQYQEVGFWDRLDLMGVNAYFPLRKRWQPELPEGAVYQLLEARWRFILRAIQAFQARLGLGSMPVVFTELGYVRRANSTVQPWAAEGFAVLPSPEGPRLVIWQDQPPDLRERALAVRALYQAHLDLGGELLEGILYWKLSTLPEHAEVEPFVLVLGQGDPLAEEIRRFQDLPWDRARQRLESRLAWLKVLKPPSL